MLTFLKRLAAPAAAFALLLMAATTAQATTVSFYTVGYFTGPAVNGVGTTFDYSGNTTSASGPNYLQQSTVTADGPAALSTVFTYHNNSQFVQNYAGGLPSIPFSVEVTTGPENVNFGYFDVQSGDAASLVGLAFTLEIHQLAPASSPSSATLVGSFSGEFKLLSSNVVLTLTSNVAYIPDAATGVKYTVEATDGDITLNRFGPSMLDGTAAVPLPGVALGGLWLLGGIGSIGGLKALRRRSAVSSA